MSDNIDLGPLSWVKSEIDLALERASGALTAHANDPTLGELGNAVKQLHQAHGALAIVGLNGVTEFADAIEALFSRLADGTVAWSDEVAQVAQQGLSALRSYLDGLVGGETNQPLKLAPTYNALRVAAGAPEPSPAALFFPDLSQRPPRRAADTPVLPADKYAARMRLARVGFERGLLKWIKGETRGAAELKTATAMIEAAQHQPNDRAFWWAAIGFFAALASEGLTMPALARDVKRVALRIGAEVKRVAAAPAGSYHPDERLMAEVLYMAAVANPPQTVAQLEVVRAAYRLHEALPQAADAAIEATRPLRRRLRELIVGAEDDWKKLCAGAAAALPPFHEKLGEVNTRAASLAHDDFARLTGAMAAVADALRRDPSRHNDAMALEMATALLLVDAALENFESLGSDFAAQVDAVASRLEAVQRGETPTDESLPHLDAMSRRAQERLLLSTVAREMASNLTAVEQTLDTYFRDTGKRESLADLSRPLSQIDGALAMLGEQRASSVLDDCRRDIDKLHHGTLNATPDVFESLAHRLSALGFFVEQVAAGQKPDIDQILAPPKAAVSDSVVAEAAADDVPSLPEMVAAVEHAPPPAVDDELLGIFLEEAHEVLGTIAEQLPKAHAAPGDESVLTTLRRSFHTLKGSGRMVGLDGLGEVAWSVEQVMNQWLQDHQPATPPLLTMLDQAAETFSGWVTALDGGKAPDFAAQDIQVQCARLLGLEPAPTVAEAATVAPDAQPADATAAAAEEPSAADLAAMLTAREQEREEAELAAAELAAAELLAESARERDAAKAITVASDDMIGLELPAVDETAVEPVDALLEAETGLPPDAPLELPPPDLVLPPEVSPQPDSQVAVPTAQIHAFPSPPPVRIGDVEVSATLLPIFMEEARGHLATLQAEANVAAVPSEAVVRAAHTLSSTAGTTGLQAIHHLARGLEVALTALAGAGAVADDAQRLLFARTVGALDGMLGAVAARRLPGEEHALTADLMALPGSLTTAPVAAPPVAEDTSDVPLDLARSESPTERRAVRITDDIDEQVLPIFLEESVDLMRSIDEQLRGWRATPGDPQFAQQLQRDLHTLKGSARMAGAMGCGELLHSMETRIEQAVALKQSTPELLDGLETSYDRAAMLIDRLRRGELAPAADVAADESSISIDHAPAEVAAAESTGDVAAHDAATPLQAGPSSALETTAAPAAPVPAAAKPGGAAQVHLRVRADLVDNLVNEAGEVAIARARIEGEMRGLKASLLELTDNVIRLRAQVREIEIEAETQMSSQISAARDRAESEGRAFDPLEFDRFTRFQELTRMMAESVNDVSTIQQGLLGNLNRADASLAAQGRLNRELSERLMNVRMVPFDSQAERLHRVVRQAAKDAGKRANLDIRGGQMGIDRSVLEHLGGPLEHLLRNAIAHGLEPADARAAAGKPALGQITISLAQEGNDVVITLVDDGGGLNVERIRQRGVERGLIAADAEVTEKDLVNLIFGAGFSTATEVTQLAGRGVGMDVVRSEVEALGGHIEVSTTAGQGAVFRLFLPLTLAVSQAVIVTAGGRPYAIPATMIEQASELKVEAISKIREAGETEQLGKRFPYFYLPNLLGDADARPLPARRHWLLLVKGGAERLAVEVDSLKGNQEIVLKAIGQQLSRVPGLAGATVLGEGDIALVLNPVALAAHAPRLLPQSAPTSTVSAVPEAVASAGCVMVVDDSLTVRKITGRMLSRRGYEVVTAKDGVDALEQLADVLPDVMLLDVEMPRMDGFELTRIVRSDPRLKAVPIIMITSRTADKHRLHALELGVNHYLGKPFDESVLFDLIAGYAGQARESAT